MDSPDHIDNKKKPSKISKSSLSINTADNFDYLSHLDQSDFGKRFCYSFNNKKEVAAGNSSKRRASEKFQLKFNNCQDIDVQGDSEKNYYAHTIRN